MLVSNMNIVPMPVAINPFLGMSVTRPLRAARLSGTGERQAEEECGQGFGGARRVHNEAWNNETYKIECSFKRELFINGQVSRSNFSDFRWGSYLPGTAVGDRIRKG